MIRKLCALCAALSLFLLAAPAFALEEPPAWAYPLAPEIIYDYEKYITLANRDHLLDSSFVPDDLVKTTVRRAKGTDAMELREAASIALSAMFEAASEAGYTLYLKSAYRAYSTQKYMYNTRLEKNHGKDDGLVSYPGASDHQTGLGVDVLNYAWTLKDGMNKEFAATAEAQWMKAHCHEFGFILRYLEDKEEITKIKFEPWHFRYVGPEAAAYIMENRLSLEEFTEEWQAYVAEYEAQGTSLEALIRYRARPRNATIVRYGEDGEEEYSIFY
ncbi:MAG: M15 family metallopeptidase [Clostridia bacterium]|nr:M15 family metallopeptidase [Clostridia bacterium]